MIASFTQRKRIVRRLRLFWRVWFFLGAACWPVMGFRCYEEFVLFSVMRSRPR